MPNLLFVEQIIYCARSNRSARKMAARTGILSAVLLVTVAPACAAWTGPGWYLFVDTMGGEPGVYLSPYANRETCKPVEDRINKELEANNKFGFIECRYIDQPTASTDPYDY